MTLGGSQAIRMRGRGKGFFEGQLDSPVDRKQEGHPMGGGGGKEYVICKGSRGVVNDYGVEGRQEAGWAL